MLKNMDFIFIFVGYTLFLHQWGKVDAKGQLRASKSILNPNFNDRKIMQGAILSYQGKNEVQCTSLCNEKAKCLSVSYNQVTQMCLLFDKDFLDDSSTAYQVGWQYSYVIKDSEQRGAYCVGQGLPIICSLYCLSYIIRPAPVLFAELAGICKSYNGGELVKIDRGLKQYCVVQLLVPESYGEILIQGKRNESDNKWRYDDGTEMTYFNWNTPHGQPNNKHTEIYVGVRKTVGYLWHDLFDKDIHAAVCQQI